MMSQHSAKCIKGMLLAGVLAASMPVSAAFAQAAQGQVKGGEAQLATPSPAPSTAPKAVPPAPAVARSDRGMKFYKRLYGIDNLAVRVTASGALLRFSYRVVDANKATVVNDKTLPPYLIDEKTGAKLVIPMMEKVGTLRQTSTPQNGREYWMVFSNKGVIQRGNRVDIVIGSFHVEGLVAE
jgi:hypothetical protein